MSIIYEATDTAADFHNDDSFVRLLLGPVGCGKSVAGCLEIYSRAAQQPAGDDGIRRSRWAVIRNTYPELETTTIKTWISWYSENEFGNVKHSSPISHRIQCNDIDLEVIFLAMDSPDDIKKLMSLELTGAYLNEAQFIDKKIFETCLQRVNRYPSKKDGAPLGWSGVILDTNPPDTDHWIYRLFEEKLPKDYRIFKYDSPLIKLDSKPENETNFNISKDGTYYVNNPVDYRSIQNDPNYWLRLVSSYTDEEIKVNIMGQYGIFIDGKPVHPSYNDKYHYSEKPLIYNPLVELGLGWDFGRTPACAIGQLNPMGELRVLDELWSEDMSLREFAEITVIPHLNLHYPGWEKNYISVHDPAGQNSSQEDGNSCARILEELGINSFPAASTNAATPRRDGLDYFLGRMSGGKPSFILGPRCKRSRKGLMGLFQYARVKVGGDSRYHDKPLKNMYSHICEALEYLAMWYSGKNKKPVTGEKKPYTIHVGSWMAL